jgi:hypothetical protein
MAFAVAATAAQQSAGGIEFTTPDLQVRSQFLSRLEELGLGQHVDMAVRRDGIRFALAPASADCLVPDWDTTGLCRDLRLDTVANLADLQQEIMLAMLAAPAPLRFPSFDEFDSAVRIRSDIVLAARRTQLAFGTSQAERPASHWTYRDGVGFILLPGMPLAEALEKATQPAAPDSTLFSFSCYRATEYVMLLAIARELARVNPSLLARLQRQWERRPIMSGQYHDTFLYEYGSADDPVPPRYYVPGDRVWFRNPDHHSSEASGYEGSWVIYLGNGLFSNFWKRDQPYSLVDKLVEIYHWRHATYLDGEGELRIDERIVEARAGATLADPPRLKQVIGQMARLRDPKGVYALGGCTDLSREFPRYVCRGTADIALPQE